MNFKDKIILSIGYLLMSFGVYSASREPPLSYELSIYSKTPITFWVSVIIALAISIISIRHFQRRFSKKIGIVLGGISVLSIILLPKFRGYYYFGTGDALVHLGWVVDILKGVFSSGEILYPGMHLLSVTLVYITNLKATSILMILPAIFALLFLLTIPISAKRINAISDKSHNSTIIAFLFMPIVAISVPVFQPIPTSLAILYVPSVILSFCLMAKHRMRNFILYIGSYIGLLLLHPQHAFVFLFISIIWKILNSVWSENHSYAALSFIPECLVAVLCVLYLSYQTGFGFALGNLISTILATSSIVEVSQATMPSTTSKIGILLTKVFVVEFVLSFFAASYVASVVANLELVNKRQDQHNLGAVAGLIVPTVFISVYVISSMPNQTFRYFAMMQIFVAIFASYGVKMADNIFHSYSAKTVITIILVIMMVLSVPTMYKSPYVNRQSAHVPASQMNGYELAFEYQPSDPTFTSIGSATYRYRAAIYGKKVSREGIGVQKLETLFGRLNIQRNDANKYRQTFIEYHFAGRDLGKSITEDIYLSITESDMKLYTKIYSPKPYTSNDFSYLNSSNNIQNVIDTGSYNLYLVRNEKSKQTNNTQSIPAK